MMPSKEYLDIAEVLEQNLQALRRRALYANSEIERIWIEDSKYTIESIAQQIGEVLSRKNICFDWEKWNSSFKHMEVEQIRPEPRDIPSSLPPSFPRLFQQGSRYTIE